MMRRHLEQALYLAAAIVIAAAPFGLDPVATGFVMGDLDLAMARCVRR